MEVFFITYCGQAYISIHHPGGSGLETKAQVVVNSCMCAGFILTWVYSPSTDTHLSTLCKNVFLILILYQSHSDIDNSNSVVTNMSSVIHLCVQICASYTRAGIYDGNFSNTQSDCKIMCMPCTYSYSDKTKNVMRCRDSRSAKSRKQLRDDSIKQFST